MVFLDFVPQFSREVMLGYPVGHLTQDSNFFQISPSPRQEPDIPGLSPDSGPLRPP